MLAHPKPHSSFVPAMIAAELQLIVSVPAYAAALQGTKLFPRC
jgi:hypothetical protein